MHIRTTCLALTASVIRLYSMVMAISCSIDRWMWRDLGIPALYKQISKVFKVFRHRNNRISSQECDGACLFLTKMGTHI